MTKQEYFKKREGLLAQAQTLIDQGEPDKAQAVTDEIKTLDESFEAAARVQANLNALTGLSTSVGAAMLNAGAPAPTAQFYDSIEYRTAFMNYVLAGTPIPQMQNSPEVTKKSDISATISPVIMKKITERIEEHGNILGAVTRTSYAPGLAVPVSSAKPSAEWVAEGASTDTQKKGVTAITFAGYKLRVAVAISLEADTMSLLSFETIFAAQVADAIIEAKETAIISGSGTGRPKGILTETPAANVDISATGNLTYKALWDVEKKIPSGYRKKAMWCMSYQTFCDIMALTDNAGQPIARVNYGLAGGSEATLLGRKVLFSEDMEPYAATVNADTVVAFVFRFEDYILNSNLTTRVKRYEDNETEDLVTKAITIADGKVIDKSSLVTLTKKKPANG